MFGNNADAFLKVYSAKTDAEAKRAAQDYEGDQFIAFSPRKWLDMQLKTGKSKVFRYEFDQTLPLAAGVAQDDRANGATCIGYRVRVPRTIIAGFAQRPEDQQVSELMALAATGPTSPKPAIQTVQTCRTGPPTTARTTIRLCTWTPKPAPAPDKPPRSLRISPNDLAR